MYSPEPISVSIAPGQIALHLMFFFAYIYPVFFVRPTSACFEAVYTAPALAPYRPPIEAMLTITPFPSLRNMFTAFLLV